MKHDSYSYLFAALLICLLWRADRLSAENPRFAPGVALGVVSDQVSKEISGMVASRDNLGVLWIHGDSGNGDAIWAIDTKGHLLGTYALPNTKTIDCEAIAIGSGPAEGVSYLYWGDIGDNNERRPHVLVYRAPEPAVLLAQVSKPVERDLVGAASIQLRYHREAKDAESMFVDPITGDLFIGTKSKKKMQFHRAAASELATKTQLDLELVATIEFAKASDASMSPDGSELLVRQEDFVRLFQRKPEQSIVDLLNADPVEARVIGIPLEPNGEAIGFDAIGLGYYTISEGEREPVYYFKRVSSGGPIKPTRLISSGAKWRLLDGDDLSGLDWTNPPFDESRWTNVSAPIDLAASTASSAKRAAGNSAVAKTRRFRHTFTLNRTDMPNLRLELKLLCGEPSQVYLNGKAVEFAGLASSVPLPPELVSSWRTARPSSEMLRKGENVVAVQIDERSASPPTGKFDLQLFATPNSVEGR